LKITSLMLLGALAAGSTVDAAPRWQQLRRAELRNEQRYYAVSQVDSAIVRAYREILRRDPDANGLASYRRQMLRNGMGEYELRQALLNSDEYRSRFGYRSNRQRWQRY
jgi:hypothetical protein